MLTGFLLSLVFTILFVVIVAHARERTASVLLWALISACWLLEGCWFMVDSGSSSSLPNDLRFELGRWLAAAGFVTLFFFIGLGYQEDEEVLRKSAGIQ